MTSTAEKKKRKKKRKRKKEDRNEEEINQEIYSKERLHNYPTVKNNR